MRIRIRYWIMAWAFALAAWVFAASATIANSQGITVTGVTAAELASADQISIIGPATAKPNTEVACRIQGTPSIDLTLPLADQLDWLMGPDRMYVHLFAPGQGMAPIDVRAEIVFGHDGATMQPMLRVDVGAAGEYRLIVDWNYGQNQLVEHLITVEGGIEPDPDPPAPEPDPPSPTEPVQLMIFHESNDLDNMPLSQLSMTSGLAFRRQFEDRGHKFHGAFDHNAVATSGCIGGVCVVNGNLNPWWKAAKGHELPCVVIAPRSGGDMKAYPLPANAEALYALIGGAE